MAIRIASVGHAVFAVLWIAFGVLGLVQGQFTPIWQGVPKVVPAHDVLVHASAVIALAAGIGLLVRPVAGVAARVMLAYLLIWFVALRVRGIVLAPGEFGSWDSAAETLVLVAAALVLHAWFAGKGLRVARILYGVAMISFGCAHFIYLEDTAGLVPGWIPAHLACAYITGATFLAAGAAMLTGIYPRLAAALSTVQIALFTLLVWVPMIVRGSANSFQWSELAVSAALACAGWVVTDSYRARTA